MPLYQARSRLIKPQGFVQVNQAHPAAKQMAAFLYYAGGTVFYDAVTQKKGATSSGQSQVVTPEGLSIHFSGSAIERGTNTNFRNQSAIISSYCTIIARLRLTTAPGANVWAASYTTSNPYGPAIGFNSSGNAIANYGGTNGLSPGSAATDAIVHTGKFATIATSLAYTTAWALPGVACSPRLWVNGVRIADGTGTGADHTVPPTAIYLGRDASNYYAEYTGDVAWVVAFNRWLSDSEHAWWAANPFAVLEQQRDKKFYSLPSSGGGSVSVSLPAAIGTATALSFTPSTLLSLSSAVGIAAAAGFTANPESSLAAASGIAAALSFIPGVQPALGAASGTAIAEPFTPQDTVTLPPASGVATAESFTPSEQRALVAATGTAAAESFGSQLLFGLTTAAGVGFVEGFTPNVIVSPASAIGIGVAASFVTGQVQLSPATGAATAESFAPNDLRALPASVGIATAETFVGDVQRPLAAASGIALAESFSLQIAPSLNAATGTSLAETFAPGVTHSLTAASGLGVAGSFLTGGVAFVPAAGVGIAATFLSQIFVGLAPAIGMALAEAFASEIIPGATYQIYFTVNIPQSSPGCSDEIKPPPRLRGPDGRPEIAASVDIPQS